MMENMFAVLFFLPLSVLLLVLLREIWRHQATNQSENHLGMETKITGAVALLLLIGTALTMWLQG